MSFMEKNRICKICNKRFANGKAMGGHMRSHFAKLPLPPKPISQQPHNPSPKSPSSSSSLTYRPTTVQNKPMQSYRSLNHELCFLPKPHLGTVVHDGEIREMESPRNPTRRRSKRQRKSAEKVAESVVKVAAESSKQQVSYISDRADEEAAWSLIKLSKDKWTKDVQNFKKGVDEYNIEVVEVEDEEEDDDEMFCVTRAPSKHQGKYKCETCNKLFPSYQALGGHKASHKKIKSYLKEVAYEEGSGTGCGGENDQRIFKCPLCDKAFGSGQALGGHKKVHFSYLGVTLGDNPKASSNLLDLNLPAPEDDGEVTQLDELPTVSNATTSHRRN